MDTTHPVWVAPAFLDECLGGIKRGPSSPLLAQPEELDLEHYSVTSSRETNCGGSRFGNVQVYRSPEESNVPSPLSSPELSSHVSKRCMPTHRGSPQFTHRSPEEILYPQKAAMPLTASRR